MDDDNVRTKIFIGDYISIGVLEKRLLDIIQKNKSYCILYKGKLIKFYLSLFLSCCRSTYFLSLSLSVHTLYI